MQRADSLEKTFMLGMIEGRRRRGWQDETIWWHHRLNGHEFKQILGDGEGHEAWHAAVHGVTKSQTQLNNNIQLNIKKSKFYCMQIKKNGETVSLWNFFSLWIFNGLRRKNILNSTKEGKQNNFTHQTQRTHWVCKLGLKIVILCFLRFWICLFGILSSQGQLY